MSTTIGVIFDLDGVIVSTDRYHRLAWQQLADELGLPFTEEQARATRGVDRMASLAVVLGEHASKFTDAQKAVADLNGDGDVDGGDVSILLEMVLSGD